MKSKSGWLDVPWERKIQKGIVLHLDLKIKSNLGGI